MKFASIDFEYNRSKDPKLNLVCCSIKREDTGGVQNFWLHNQTIAGAETRSLLFYLESLRKSNYVFLAYNVIAEARSFLALGLNPLNFKWVDLYLEYRCLANHNNDIMYGMQLKKGRVVNTYPPKNKWEIVDEEEENKKNKSKPEYNLGAACFKLLGKKIDTGFKDATRDLIISDPEEFTDEEKTQIMEYCASDVKYLKPMFDEVWKLYKSLDTRLKTHKLLEEMYARSEYAARSSRMEEIGYPINVARTRNFSRQVPAILYKCQSEINQYHPNTFRRNSDYSYSLIEANARERIQDYCTQRKSSGIPIKWMLTKGGKSGNKKLSLSRDAFTKHFSFRHSYPLDNWFAQMVRFLKLKRNLYGFVPSGKSNFWDYFCEKDNRVRPYMGIYGSQTARSQPSSTGFIPLKSAWMRTLIEPAKGKAICGIDYASQEFLIAGLLANDENMLEDYESGDVYLAYGKGIGFIPQDATKASHKKERDMCKPVVLGLQFDMSKYGLAKDLTEKWGREVSTDEAQEWIEKYHDRYKKLFTYKNKNYLKYKSQGFLKLPCGWYLWGDQNNKRSVGNFPIQGMGSSIMRKAVQLAQEEGLDVIYTLHDAIYIEFNVCSGVQEPVRTLARCMHEAFSHYFRDKVKSRAICRLDADVWGPDISISSDSIKYGEGLSLPVSYKKEYVDERGVEELEKFRRYFEKPTMEDF